MGLKLFYESIDHNRSKTKTVVLYRISSTRRFLHVLTINVFSKTISTIFCLVSSIFIFVTTVKYFGLLHGNVFVM